MEIPYHTNAAVRAPINALYSCTLYTCSTRTLSTPTSFQSSSGHLRGALVGGSFLRRQPLRRIPRPPNSGLSRQLTHTPQLPRGFAGASRTSVCPGVPASAAAALHARTALPAPLPTPLPPPRPPSSQLGATIRGRAAWLARLARVGVRVRVRVRARVRVRFGGRVRVRQGSPLAVVEEPGGRLAAQRLRAALHRVAREAVEAEALPPAGQPARLQRDLFRVRVRARVRVRVRIRIGVRVGARVRVRDRVRARVGCW